MRRILLILALPLMLNGCIAALLAGGTEVGVTASENRSVGQKVSDTELYTNVTNQFIKADDAKLIRDVTFNIRYGRVMLTGTVDKEADAQRAVALTWKAKGVLEVINELVVDPNSGFFSTANDSLIKRNLESRILITKGVWVINYSIDVQNGTAYLIGRVKDKAELDRVLNIARTTRGVKHVTSHLQINPNTDDQGGKGITAQAAPVDSVSSNPTSGPTSGDYATHPGAPSGDYTPRTTSAIPNPPVSQSSTVPAPDSISSGDLSPKK